MIRRGVIGIASASETAAGSASESVGQLQLHMPWQRTRGATVHMHARALSRSQ